MKMNPGRVQLGFGCGTWRVEALKLSKLFEAGLGETQERLMPQGRKICPSSFRNHDLFNNLEI